MSTARTARPATLDDSPATAAAAAAMLAARVDGLPRPAERCFVRAEVQLDEPDFLRWLRNAPHGSRRYFRDRQGKVEIAAAGIAARDEPGQHAEWRQSPVRGRPGTPSAWFMALPFDRERPRDAAWRDFGDLPCVLPSVELRRSGSTATLAVNVTASTDRGALRELLARLADPPSACSVEPALVREDDPCDEAGWMHSVTAALARIRAGAMRKVVLARRRRYRASSALDPVALLTRLAARESRGFRFLVEVAPGRAFVGVTPERLVSRAGTSARSEAVAGTRPRGVDAVADRLLGESLTASAKDRTEHELVVERVRDALASCAATVRTDAEPRLLRLAYVQHLLTRVHAELRPGVTDLDLVESLHPTPAVAGAPVTKAIDALRELEPFDRGLYAGPLGVMSAEGAEVAVAIRSALVEGDRLTAFAGAGIVEGSDPAEEWRETGHKLLAFERLAS
jgi:menaquinone-specific isochorismate synthase